MIRVLIADDIMLMREGLQTILSLEDDMEIAGVAKSAEEAVELTLRLEPDLVLMDIQMPGIGGIEGIRRIMELRPETKVLILTTFVDDEYIVDGLASGACGFLMKDLPGDKLIQSIRDAHNGHLMLPAAVGAKLAARLAKQTAVPYGFEAVRRKAEGASLSEKERAIAELLIAGNSNREIAADQIMSEGTVRNYVSSIYGKIGTNDRTIAIMTLKLLLGK
ncbi:response regulator transcription factor [Cohnella caldifontis]|uniref:response regulator transcription factor n=1 Tax=Cohnella caldifontis TaxID=3027471 RepID=UPI0023ECC2DB|nr:response regulator transcription factor [Cohnella sp. YIM B05605]